MIDTFVDTMKRAKKDDFLTGARISQVGKFYPLFMSSESNLIYFSLS
jgi:hypothetical protein